MTQELTVDMVAKLVRDNEILSSDMDGETVMMSIENGEYYGLNPVGSRIWELLDQPVSMNDMVKTLLAEFDVEEAQCIDDMKTFVADLMDKKLIKKV